jgi:hypothetical protein
VVKGHKGKHSMSLERLGATTKFVDFTAADTDGDGKISRDEARAAGMSDADFNAADTDKNGHLSKAEVDAWNAKNGGGSNGWQLTSENVGKYMLYAQDFAFSMLGYNAFLDYYSVATTQGTLTADTILKLAGTQDTMRAVMHAKTIIYISFAQQKDIREKWALARLIPVAGIQFAYNIMRSNQVARLQLKIAGMDFAKSDSWTSAQWATVMGTYHTDSMSYAYYAAFYTMIWRQMSLAKSPKGLCGCGGSKSSSFLQRVASSDQFMGGDEDDEPEDNDDQEKTRLQLKVFSKFQDLFANFHWTMSAWIQIYQAWSGLKAATSTASTDTWRKYVTLWENYAVLYWQLMLTITDWMNIKETYEALQPAKGAAPAPTALAATPSKSLEKEETEEEPEEEAEEMSGVELVDEQEEQQDTEELEGSFLQTESSRRFWWFFPWMAAAAPAAGAAQAGNQQWTSLNLAKWTNVVMDWAFTLKGVGLWMDYMEHYKGANTVTALSAIKMLLTQDQMRQVVLAKQVIYINYYKLWGTADGSALGNFNPLLGLNFAYHTLRADQMNRFINRLGSSTTTATTGTATTTTAAR